MTIPFWCLAAASLMPFILFGLAVPHRVSQFGALDSNHPRIQWSRLEGLGNRLVSAHNNAFEALLVFAPAVIVAHLAGADAGWSNILAITFIACRVLHPVFYATDKAALRSVVFAVGLAASLGFYVLAATA